MNPIQDMGKDWGGVINRLRDIHRSQCRMCRWNCAFVFFNFGWALCCVTLLSNHLGALVQVLIGWWMYRRYLRSIERERLCLEALNHAQRMWVEEAERGFWHSQQLNLCLDKLKYNG